MTGSLPFSQYIKLIGRGQRSGQYLTTEQAYDAMHQVLNGDALPEQVSAFLMLLRVREESAEELAGFLLACRQHSYQILRNMDAVHLDLGCYAGKRRHLPWFVLAVMVLAQQGYKVFLHGTTEPDSQRLYLDKVWQAFDWPVATNTSQAATILSDYGFCYMDLAHINPALHRLIQLRSILGLRSCANTLARMLNPTNATVSLHGVFHREFDARHIAVANITGDDNVACYRGEGGEVEVNPEREFVVHKLHQGQASTLEFETLLPSWQIKLRELDIQKLKQCWCGESQDNYGDAAVVGSLAVMLAVIKHKSAEESVQEAKSLWHNRIRHWPQLNTSLVA